MSTSSRASVLLVALLVPLIAAIAVFSVTLLAHYRQAQTAAVEALEESTWRVAQPVRDATNHIRDQVTTLGNAAAALHAASTAPLPALAELLRHEIAGEPLYDQIRFVGPPPDGRELIRFNRIDGRVEPAAGHMLQRKGHRDYYRAAIALPGGQTDLSITLNREFGELQHDRPMLRAATPVLVNGRLVGVVVINLDFRRLLRRLQSDRVPRDARLYMANADGYWIAHPDPAKTFGFERNRSDRVADDFPMLAKSLAELGIGQTRLVRHDGGWIAVHRMALARGEAATIDVMLSRDDVDLKRAVAVGAWWAALVTLPLMGLAGLAALELRRRFVTPLLTVAQWAERVERGEYDLGPAPTGADEVRTFAARFATMAARLCRRERDLTHRNDELETLFQTVPSPVLMATGHGPGPLIANPSASSLLGPLGPDGELGKDVDLRCDGTPLPREEWPWRKAGRTGEVISDAQYTLHRPGREPRFLLANAVPLRDELGQTRGAVAVLTDVTERHAFEQSLLASNRRLTRLNAELEQFAFAASHDLKAPLRGVSHLVTLFSETYGECFDETGRQWLERMKQRVVRMHELLEGLLVYARSGGDSGPAVEVDTGALAREVVVELELPDTFSVTIAPSMPEIKSPRGPLRQVFRNVLENAVAHHDRPSDGHVAVAAEMLEDGWRFTITDDGPGIPAHARDQVFRIFYTLEGSEEHVRGIGLAVVAKLIAEQGGSVGIDAAAPRGTRLWFTWPEVRSSDPVRSDGPE